MDSGKAGVDFLKPFIEKEKIQELEKSNDQHTVMLDGRVVLVGGLIPLWPGRAEAWAIIHQETRHCFAQIHTRVKRFLDIVNMRYQRNR